MNAPKLSKVRNQVNKTALEAAVIEYRNQGWSQQRIANHLGYSRSYIRKLLGASDSTEKLKVSHSPVPELKPEFVESRNYSVPELQRVMEAVQVECRKLVKLEQEEIQNQVLEDLQLERRLYLSAIVLLGASPAAVLNSPDFRRAQLFISSLQQLSSVIHKNTQALLKIYGLDAEKNVDMDIFNIDFIAAAREGGLDVTGFDAGANDHLQT